MDTQERLVVFGDGDSTSTIVVVRSWPRHLEAAARDLSRLKNGSRGSSSDETEVAGWKGLLYLVLNTRGDLL